MAKEIVKLVGHKLLDAIIQKQYEVRGRKISNLTANDYEVDETVIPVPESPTCSKPGDCFWNHVVINAGDPCSRCRNFTPGDFYRK